MPSSRHIVLFVVLVVCLLASSLLAWYGTQSMLAALPEASPQFNITMPVMLFWLISLLLLTVRYLMMLTLAIYDWWIHQLRAPEVADADLPFVSVIMPVYNEAAMIKPALQSLIDLDYPAFEVLVVDDGSKDASFTRALVLALDTSKVSVRVLTKPNGGKSDALNFGLSKAHGDIVLCVDGDSAMDPQALRLLARHFVDPTVGAVAGCVRVINDKTLWSAMQALEYISGYGLLKRAQNAGHVVSVVPGPIGAFRKAAVAQVGGYGHDTFAEDYDLTVKLLGAGWHVKYEPKAVVFTEAPEALNDLIKQRYRWTRGALQVARKRSYALFNWTNRPLTSLGVWYLWIDNLLWPLLNVGSMLAFIFAGTFFGLHELMVFWWAQVLALDIAIAAFCIAIEAGRLRLVAWSLPYRFLYQTVMDVVRLIAILEEFMGLKMSWGQIKRLGRTS
jgi:poly-beta-1,6-N-acetyl-D-glucosamine synthase